MRHATRRVHMCGNCTPLINDITLLLRKVPAFGRGLQYVLDGSNATYASGPADLTS